MFVIFEADLLSDIFPPKFERRTFSKALSIRWFNQRQQTEKIEVNLRVCWSIRIIQMNLFDKQTDGKIIPRISTNI